MIGGNVNRFLCVMARIAGLGTFVCACAAPALAWGPVAHRVVHTRAIAALPKDLREFFREHRREMPTLSEEAEPAREEGSERRFAVDRFGAFPFLDLPKTEAELVRRHGEAAREAGRLPWLIQASYARLVERFRSGDKVEILTEADWLALRHEPTHRQLVDLRARLYGLHTLITGHFEHEERFLMPQLELDTQAGQAEDTALESG